MRCSQKKKKVNIQNTCQYSSQLWNKNNNFLKVSIHYVRCWWVLQRKSRVTVVGALLVRVVKEGLCIQQKPQWRKGVRCEDFWRRGKECKGLEAATCLACWRYTETCLTMSPVGHSICPSLPLFSFSLPFFLPYLLYWKHVLMFRVEREWLDVVLRPLSCAAMNPLRHKSFWPPRCYRSTETIQARRACIEEPREGMLTQSSTFSRISNNFSFL